MWCNCCNMYNMTNHIWTFAQFVTFNSLRPAVTWHFPWIWCEKCSLAVSVYFSHVAHPLWNISNFLPLRWESGKGSSDLIERNILRLNWLAHKHWAWENNKAGNHWKLFLIESSEWFLSSFMRTWFAFQQFWFSTIRTKPKWLSMIHIHVSVTFHYSHSSPGNFPWFAFKPM